MTLRRLTASSRRFLGSGVVALLTATGVAMQPGAQGRSVGWKDYGGGPDSSKFVAIDEITRANVGRLQVAWTYPTGDNVVYSFNPLVVDDVMYVMGRNSSLIALEAATGKEIWIHENLRGIARRGVNYWEAADRTAGPRSRNDRPDSIQHPRPCLREPDPARLRDR
jgi:quinoprotein glucose dehydrogenase